jgi:hypothetical protein
MLRLAADENFNGDIVRGLLRRNPQVDIVRVQDVGLSGANDPAVLRVSIEAPIPREGAEQPQLRRQGLYALTRCADRDVGFHRRGLRRRDAATREKGTQDGDDAYRAGH